MGLLHLYQFLIIYNDHDSLHLLADLHDLQVSLADFLVIAAEAVIASTRARAAGTASLDLRSIFRFGRRTWDVWTRVTR